MARHAALMALAGALDAALASGNWPALRLANRAIGKALPSFAAQGRWSAPERVALVRLRTSHADAVQRCAAAVDQLGRQLTIMAINKEGWIAYALHDATGSGTPP